MTQVAPLNPADLAALVQAMMAQQNGTKKRKGKKAKAKAPRTTPELKAQREAHNDAMCIKVFTEAGYKDVRPRETVLTHKRWKAVGRKVREGEKSLKVGAEGHQFSLFHISQTDPDVAEKVAA